MKYIEHKAVVVAVEGSVVEVEMTVEEACAGCRAKEICGVGTGERRVVAVHDSMAQYYEVGEQVSISIEEIMGVKAVIYTYIIPFFIMITLLLGLKAAEASDLVAGGSALLAAGLYYVVLWFFRSRLEKEIVFKIKKL
ncbi:MAG: Fis family transcriptional regulator [Rikenellaceae bacterium]|nr:Fis family transcriptional regulator [Rikenellaceae bacterium]MBR2443057.1 SoxR reducing system RseC family protein [Rikenellaceae bacterium]